MDTREATIEVASLHKRFGPVVALDGMTFTVAPGQVTGFVGPNGAGKSTTMRVILGLDAPDEGHALIGGQRYQGLPGQQVVVVLEQAGLEKVARRKAGGYSLGMRQRLGIAAAMLGDPPVLMFDEPFNGMDPEGIVWMRGFLGSLAEQGRAVLVSSHLMSELEGSADHLVVVGRGKVIADTTVAELIAAASGDKVSLRTTAQSDAIGALTRAGATVAASDRDTLTVSGLTSERVVAVLSGAGVPFSEISAHRATLEEAYMELTRDAVEYRAEPAADPREVAR